MAGHDAGGHGKGDAHAEGGEHKKHKKHHPHRHEEHEHEEGWIVSFADNVLLMMGFFVILLALNMGPKGTSDGAASTASNERLADFAIAVREAFHNPVNMGSKDPNDLPLIRRIRERETQGDDPSRGPDGEDHKPQTIRPGDWTGEDGLVLFADGETRLTEDAKRTARQFSERAVGTRWMVEIRGHASKWETWGDARKSRDLSYERAWAAANELIRHGISWDQIRLVACGDATPFRSGSRDGTSREGRGSNQRVELLMLKEEASPDPFAAGAGKR
jgi:flagellar motor protein MotB